MKWKMLTESFWHFKSRWFLINDKISLMQSKTYWKTCYWTGDLIISFMKRNLLSITFIVYRTSVWKCIIWTMLSFTICFPFLIIFPYFKISTFTTYYYSNKQKNIYWIFGSINAFKIFLYVSLVNGKHYNSTYAICFEYFYLLLYRYWIC